RRSGRGAARPGRGPPGSTAGGGPSHRLQSVPRTRPGEMTGGVYEPDRAQGQPNVQQNPSRSWLSRKCPQEEQRSTSPPPGRARDELVVGRREVRGDLEGLDDRGPARYAAA